MHVIAPAADRFASWLQVEVSRQVYFLHPALYPLPSYLRLYLSTFQPSDPPTFQPFDPPTFLPSYLAPQVSANADILLFYFGWLLRIPKLAGWALRLPFTPWLAALLCRVLPARLVRGRTCGYTCDWDGCDV